MITMLTALWLALLAAVSGTPARQPQPEPVRMRCFPHGTQDASQHFPMCPDWRQVQV